MTFWFWFDIIEVENKINEDNIMKKAIVPTETIWEPLEDDCGLTKAYYDMLDEMYN